MLTRNSRNVWPFGRALVCVNTWYDNSKPKNYEDAMETKYNEKTKKREPVEVMLSRTRLELCLKSPAALPGCFLPI